MVRVTATVTAMVTKTAKLIAGCGDSHGDNNNNQTTINAAAKEILKD
jgi:hypothetical protein